MTDLGYKYQEGQGVDADGAKALQWYQKAADAGDADAKNWVRLHPNGQ